MTDHEEIYLTTTETLYPGDTDFDSVIVRLYGRTAEHEPRTVSVRGFPPYFLTRRTDADKVAEADYEDLIEYQEVDIDPLSERFDANPTDLVKVVTEYPHSIRNLRDEFEKTWGADCLFTERLRIDENIRTGVRVPTDTRRGEHIIVDRDELEPVEMTDVEPRVLTLDIETDDRGAGFPDPGEARILSIAVHESYDDEYEVFLDLDGESFEDFFDLSALEQAKMADGDLSLSDIGMTEPDSLNFEPSERRMLIAFGSWVQDKNPDLIVGWNSGDSKKDGFDLPHIIERMKSVGASPQRLSREREVEVDDRGDDFKPSITGRALYDLMDGWGDTKFTEPRSFKLDDVAADVLDKTKIEHQEMGFFEMYEDDPVKFVNYNVKDTRLTVEVNDAENVLGFKKRLKDMVGVDWRRTHQNNEFIEMSVRRKCAEHDLAMITAYDNPYVANAGDGVNYEGAYVFPSFSGVKKNVCGVDLASLYPMTQWMLNASPDTRIEVEPGTDEWDDVMEEVGYDLENGRFNYVQAANDQRFRTDHDGIIRELVDEYHEVKAEFKAERNSAKYGTDEWEEAAEAYNVTKTIYNSFYGYSGWARSPLYNPHDAAAITLTGQRVIKGTAEYISNNAKEGVEVVYGDTDSNYVEFPDEWSQEETLEYATQLCEELEEKVYPELCDEFFIPRDDNRWEIEVEMRAERFFQSGSKKRYAYLKMWDEGDDFDKKVNDGEGKFSVTGYDCVKSNFSLMTKETQEKVLEQIVRGADKGKVVETVHKAASSIDPADPDWDYIGVPQGLGKKIDPDKADSDDYYSWSTTGDHPRDEAPRAAWFANHLLDIKLSKGDKPKRMKVKPGQTVRGEQVDVIAFDSARDLEDIDITVDASEAQRKCLKNPMEDILEAFGVETEAALRGSAESQSGLSAFM
jgi:DNA polymerase I